MTAVLIAVIVLLLAVVAVLGVMLSRLARAARDQSAARAAALAELIGVAPRADGPVSAGAYRSSATAAINDDLPLDVGRDASGTDRAGVPLPAMFGAAVEPPVRSRLVLVPAVGVLIVGVALGGIYFWNRPAASTTSAAAQSSVAPLELVSLRHQRQGDSLTISGLIRNPDAGRPVQGLSAVAFAFDRQGTFLTSGRASLDFPQLRPGDESPFAITIPAVSGVGRYRVSFRTETGIVPHVDRRDQPIAALR
jgi:hypothetical protein